MIHEDYVTFEQAKALKELGFLTHCDYFYSTNHTLNSYHSDEWDGKILYDAPTLSLVQKWLREEKYIELYCIPCMYDDEMKSYEFEIVRYHHIKLPYDSYENALSAGIDECIKLLKL